MLDDDIRNFFMKHLQGEMQVQRDMQRSGGGGEGQMMQGEAPQMGGYNMEGTMPGETLTPLMGGQESAQGLLER